jgi:excisionase family DNA binding protein
VRDSQQMLSVPEIAKRLRVNEDKVRGWLVNGELRGVDVSARRGKRPRWRIDPADLEAFLARRVAQPTPRTTGRVQRRRRAETGIIEFY